MLLVCVGRSSAAGVCIPHRICGSWLGNARRPRRWLHSRAPAVLRNRRRGEPRLYKCFSRLRRHALNRTSAGLENIVARALHRAPAAESALLAWPVACGSAVADRTRALSFSDGILTVEVADAGWRRELANLAPRYLALVNKFSAASVKRIEFVVKGETGQAPSLQHES